MTFQREGQPAVGKTDTQSILGNLKKTTFSLKPPIANRGRVMYGSIIQKQHGKYANVVQTAAATCDSKTSAMFFLSSQFVIYS